jgi:hypothetical protein
MLGLERLVVLFPPHWKVLYLRLMVDDVLITVHRAVQALAMERIWHEIWPEKDTGIESRDPSPCPTYDHTTMVSQDLGRGGHWRAGLYPSQKERDVWVLRTRRVSNC